MDLNGVRPRFSLYLTLDSISFRGFGGVTLVFAMVNASSGVEADAMDASPAFTAPRTFAISPAIADVWANVKSVSKDTAADTCPSSVISTGALACAMISFIFVMMMDTMSKIIWDCFQLV
jgi:hypothetical protein